MVKSKVKLRKQEGHWFLWIDGYLWMWDIPVEQQAQYMLSKEAYGDVLVAGYGLGILQRFLEKNPNVTSITTVEISKEVIYRVRQKYRVIHGQIIFDDFFKFETGQKLDCVIGDVWEDIEPKALAKYNEFETHARKFIKPDGNVLGWGQGFFQSLNIVNALQELHPDFQQMAESQTDISEHEFILKMKELYKEIMNVRL